MVEPDKWSEMVRARSTAYQEKVWPTLPLKVTVPPSVKQDYALSDTNVPRGGERLNVRNRTPVEKNPVGRSAELRVTLATADRVGLSILITHPGCSRCRERNLIPVGDKSTTRPGIEPGLDESTR